MVELTHAQRGLVEAMAESDRNAAYGFGLIVEYERPHDFFRPLRDAGFFDRSRNPGPQPAEKGGFYIPYWPALTYLTKIAAIVSSTRNVELGHELMQIVRTLGPDASGETVDNYRTHVACAEISGLVPPECVLPQDIELAATWLRSRWSNDAIVKELSDGLFKSHLREPGAAVQEKLARLLEISTELKPGDAIENYHQPQSIADAYWLEKLLEKHSAALGRVVGWPAVSCLISRCEQAFGEGNSGNYSWLNRPAIENHEQNADWDYVRGALVEGARDSLAAWVASATEETRPIVQSMLEAESQITRRLAIHTVRTNWRLLSEVLFDRLTPRLFQYGHLHELYLLLSEHFADLDDPHKQQIRQVVFSLGAGLSGDDLDRALHLERNWLHALQGRGDADVDGRYAQLVQSLGEMRDHPDLLSYHQSSWGPGPSPLGVAELMAAADDGSLVNVVDGFVPAEHEHRSPRKALLDNISKAVGDAPERFTRYISSSSGMSRGLEYALLRGYAEKLSSKEETIDSAFARQVPSLLAHLAAELDSDSFWIEPVEENDDLLPTKNWIPSLAAEIVMSTASHDSLPFVEEQHGHALTILRSILTHEAGIESADDALTAAINNPRGKAFQALLSVILRSCRDADQAEGSHVTTWEAFRPVVEAELGREGDVALEVHALLGNYVPQLSWVSPSWTERSLPVIFSESSEAKFLAALTGLGYANATAQLYELLTSADIPARCLESAAVAGFRRERMLERVALAYMWGKEELEGRIIDPLFAVSRLDDLQELVSTISRWSDSELDSVQRQRARSLAKKCSEFGLASPHERVQLLATTARFIGFAPEPTTEDMGWLIAVAPFAIESHGFYEFAESVRDMAVSHPAQASEILTAALSRRTPSYDYHDALRVAIETIHAAGLRREALRLLDRLVTEGMYSLTQLFEELRGQR